MRAKFKFHRHIEGVHFAPGEHEIPEELEDHWYLEGLHKAGDVQFLEQPKESAPPEDAGDEDESKDAPEGLTDEPQVPSDSDEQDAEEAAEEPAQADEAAEAVEPAKGKKKKGK